MKLFHGDARVGWLAVAVVAMGCGSGGAAEVVRPEAPSAGSALGEESAACHDVSAGSSPLVVDWKPEQRGDLEVAMKDGLAVLEYSCNRLRILPDCKIAGEYGFVGMTRREQVVRLNNRDEVSANLPLNGVALGAELSRGSAIDIAMVLVGKQRTTWRSPTQADLEGNCEGATHYVKSANVGAFAMQQSANAKTRAAAEIFAAGVSNASASDKSSTHRDGDLKACQTAAPDAASAPAQCGAPVRLDLLPIAATPSAGAAASEPAASPPKSLCPEGLVLAEGKCTQKQAAAAYLCSGEDQAECRAQCDKGNLESCALLASLLGSAPEANTLNQRACEGGVAAACVSLGRSQLESGDAASALKAFAAGCAGGESAGCTGQFEAKVAAGGTATEGLPWLERGCSGGDARGCAQLAQHLRQSTGDARRIQNLEARACQGGLVDSCLAAGEAFEFGAAKNAVVASTFYRRACLRGSTRACFHLGRSSYEQQPSQAKTHFQTACLKQEKLACAALNVLFGDKRPLFAEPQLSQSLRGDCNRGDANACMSLGLLEAGAGHSEAAKPLLNTACTRGSRFACTLKGKL